MQKTLWNLGINQTGTIRALRARSVMRRRLMDLGFVEGAEIKKLLSRRAICAYSVRGTVIALRREDARDIIIK